MGELKREVPSQAAHLCVDMQRIFSTEGPWPTPWMERVLPNTVALAAHAPDRTIFTRFITPHRAADMPGTWARYYEKWPEVTRTKLDPRLLHLMPELERFVPPAAVFDKMVYSAFANGRLHAELLWAGSKDRGPVTQTVLTGPDLERLALFDWQEATPLQVERAADGKVTALVYRGQKFRRA